MENNNVMPHNLGLEQAIIAGLMADCDDPDEIFSTVDVDDFYDPKHKILYKACINLHNQNKNPDALIVRDYLTSKGALDKAGGEEYLGQILRDSPSTTINAIIYAQRVKQFAVLRALIKKANSVVEMAYNTEGKDILEVLDIAETEIMAVRENIKSVGNAKIIKGIATDSLLALEERFYGGGKLPGLSFGNHELDELTLGLEKKKLIIIGGRPSQGKTTFLMNVVESIMTSDENKEKIEGAAGLVFTMEMENESIVENMFSSMSKVVNYKIRKGTMDDYDWPKLTPTIAAMSEMNLYLDDRAGLSLQEMRAEARKIAKKNKNGLAFIAVDYLQRMRSLEKFDTNSQRVGSYSAGLKRMAKDFDCPVIALAQLNRALGSRTSKKPTLSDLRDSGEIEQDGDLILFIHREEYYQKTPDNEGKAEIIIAKQRKGATGGVILNSALHFCRFEEIKKVDEKW